jgi:hypothetical protein
MSYIGSTPVTQSFIAGTDYFNGNGSTTAFTLSRSVVSVNDIQATVNNVVQQPNDAYTVSGTTITFTSAPSAGTNNIYVRYLSTTTQAISPSQGTVGWAQLNSDTQQDLGISFKNRIINGAMQIDQRNAGASTTPTTNGSYSLDRWKNALTQSSKFSIQQDAGAVTPPVGFTDYLGITSTSSYAVASGDLFGIQQGIEGYNIADLNWGTANAKTVTLSFWVRSSLTGSFGGSITDSAGIYTYVFGYTINTANTWEKKSITIVGPTSGGSFGSTNGAGFYLSMGIGAGSTYTTATTNTWLSGAFYMQPAGSQSVVGTNGATWYLTGVQLEVGTQATTFTTAGGSYGAELALCQRYYEVAGQGIVGIPNSGSGIYALVNFKVAKRTSPSVSLAITNPTCIQWGISNRTASGATVASTYINESGGSIRVEGFSGVTVGSPGGFVDNNTFQFSAEL